MKLPMTIADVVKLRDRAANDNKVGEGRPPQNEPSSEKAD